MTSLWRKNYYLLASGQVWSTSKLKHFESEGQLEANSKLEMRKNKQQCQKALIKDEDKFFNLDQPVKVINGQMPED